jgi:hypothetical protein
MAIVSLLVPHGKVPATAMASAFPLLFSPLARPHGHGSIAARKRPAGFLHKVAIASIFPIFLHYSICKNLSSFLVI